MDMAGHEEGSRKGKGVCMSARLHARPNTLWRGQLYVHTQAYTYTWGDWSRTQQTDCGISNRSIHGCLFTL